MNAINRTLAIALLTTLLGACNGSNDSARPTTPAAGVVVAADRTFSGFVRTQVSATKDDSDSVQVDTTEFEFNDEGNPDAFSTSFSD